MTEEQIQELIDAKAAVISRLQSYDPTPKDAALHSVAPRVLEYTQAVIQNADAHCLYELLAVERFYAHLNRPDVRFDTQAFMQICKVHSSVKQDSEVGRRSFDPTPCQAFQYASLYGLTLDTGQRLYQKACLEVPRKYSKTSQIGIIVLNELINGPANGQIYYAACSERQAQESFRLFKGLASSVDPQGTVFKQSKDTVHFRPSYQGYRESFVKAVANNADTLDGLHASVCILDEISQADSFDTKDVLWTSAKGRANPLLIEITTASANLTGPFYQELQAYHDILLGNAPDPDPRHPIFLHLFEMDPGDDPLDVATWHKVHPHLGITVTEEDYTRDLAEAKLTGDYTAFRTKMLNEFVTQTGREFISARKIMDAYSPFTLEDLAGADLEYSIAVDLSDADDFTSFTVLGWSPKTHKHYFYSEIFFPEGRLAAHPNCALYTRWAKDGHLRLMPGDFVDQASVAARIIEVANLLSPRRIYYDKFHALETKSVLAGYGYADILKPVDGRNAAMTPIVRYVEKVINTGKAVFPGNPIDAFCWSNVVLEEDTHGNVRPVKRQRTKCKIDSAVTCIYACNMFFDGTL